MNEPLSDEEAEFYYYGLLSVLRRYRYMTILGWVIVLLGFSSIVLGWKLGLPHGVIDLVLSAVAILAGILVVQQAVMSLESYVNVPFRTGEAFRDTLIEFRDLMTSMKEGGWWEASAGIRALEAIGKRRGLEAPK